MGTKMAMNIVSNKNSLGRGSNYVVSGNRNRQISDNPRLDDYQNEYYT
ncbi:MAG TPA: hypothetical protein VHH33_03295 [Nitrososphaeraceae archaeon]|nr:hypothetical protein [Nitrososphaeraceae archaeon]